MVTKDSNHIFSTFLVMVITNQPLVLECKVSLLSYLFILYAKFQQDLNSPDWGNHIKGNHNFSTLLNTYQLLFLNEVGS